MFMFMFNSMPQVLMAVSILGSARERHAAEREGCMHADLLSPCCLLPRTVGTGGRGT
jgi:hypothetical protein